MFTVIGNYAYMADDTSGLAAIPLNLNSIEDLASNQATLTLASPGSTNSLGTNKAIVVDNTVPTVSSVNSTKDNGIL